MTYQKLSGLLAALVTAMSALGAIWARFVALEEARANQQAWMAEMADTVRGVSERVDVLERSREMLERVHALELRIERVEGRQSSAPPHHQRAPR